MTDRDWQAQDDARTLARAEEIKADPNKMNAAKIAARIMVSEEERRIQGLKKVSGKQVRLAPNIVTQGDAIIPVNTVVTPIVFGMKFGLGKQPGTF